VPLVLLTFFACPFFASSWITASISQLCGQIVVTAIVATSFYGRISLSSLILKLLTYNSGLIFGPFMYRDMERFQKNLVFLGWEIDEELKNWKELISLIPAGIIIVRDKEVVYHNKAVQSILKFDLFAGVGNESVRFNEGAETNNGNHILKEELRNVIHQGDHTHTLYNILFDVQSPYNSAHRNILEKNTTGDKFYYRSATSTFMIPLAVNITRLSLGSENTEVVVIQDLTIYEQLNEEKSYREAQKVFFAMITHELRNPLQGVLGVFELLKSVQTNEDSAKQCEIGLNTGKLMLCLIQDILDLSQIEADKFTLNDESFSPGSAITECVEVLAFQYRKKRIGLNTNNLCPTGLEIRNDKTRYKQIVFNLLGNALKFTQEGHVDVEVSYQNGTLATTIADTGTGIKPEEQQSLFQVYGKMESHKRNNPHGVGFGLNICKRLSEAMGGSIMFRSEYGHGTSFTFVVQDRKESSEEKSVATNGIRLNLQSSSSLHLVLHSLEEGYRDKLQHRVLTVDDNFECGFVMHKLTKSFGYEADLVCSLNITLL